MFALLAFSVFYFAVVVFNDGEIRGYMLLGLACGILVYWALISRVINKILFWVIYILFKIVSFPVKMVARIKRMVKKRKEKN